MNQFYNYDLYIFDCDGVIFDSNKLKIQAMRDSLVRFDANKVEKCIDYFSANFGKSRYHHVDHFVSVILAINESDAKYNYQSILDAYSKKCFDLYLTAEFTKGFLEFASKINRPKYVASGSDQHELRKIFNIRGVDKYFIEVLGSPKSKEQNVRDVLKNHQGEKALMIGDALSDFYAAKENNIDFLFVTEHSTNRDAIMPLVGDPNIIYNFIEILKI